MLRQRALALLFVPLLLPTSVAFAQITLDGSLGGGGKLTGPNYRIGSDRGAAKGGNLFFSFRDFNIHPTESATFTGPGVFNNVLARVTGGNPSTINGVLRSDIPGAHLYLLNPAGVLFGANARLDVQGSFHASTANHLKFADGAVFHAGLGGKSTLTVAAPVAFGFVGPTVAPITVQPGAALQVPAGQTLSLVGGDIQVDGASLTAPGGRINLVSVASAGEVRLGANETLPTLEGFSALGSIDVTGGSVVDVSGPSGGTIVIRGGHLRVDRSALFANTQADLNGAATAIDIDVTGDVILSNGSMTSSDGIRVQADTVSLLHSTVERISPADETVGQIEFSVRDNLTLDSSRIGSFQDASSPSGLTSGANIRLFADTITLTNSDVRSSSGLSSPGTIEIRGRNLSLEDSHLEASDGLRTPSTAIDIVLTGHALLNRSSISIHSEDGFGPRTLRLSAQTISAFDSQVKSDGFDGSANVTISASGRVEFRGGRVGTLSVFGSPGSVTINAGAFDLADATLTNTTAVHAGSVSIRGSRIIFEGGGGPCSRCGGAGGQITLMGADSVYIADSSLNAINGVPFSGPGGGIDISATNVSVIRSVLLTNSVDSGGAGGVTLKGDTITVRDSAIDSSSGFSRSAAGGVEITGRKRVSLEGATVRTTTFSAEAAGDVIVAAPSIRIDHSSVTSDTVRDARAGNVLVAGTEVSVSGGSIISAETFGGGGAGGSVTVHGGAAIDISGSSVSTNARGGTGPAGSVTVTAPTITIRDGGAITASSAGTGASGDVIVKASDALHLGSGSTIATSARSADGGNIFLNAGRIVDFQQSAVTSSVGTGAGTGGNITIGSDSVILNHSVIQANAFGGPGGNVTINAGIFLASPDSVISASSATNVAGTIAINAAFTNIYGAVAPLTEDLASAATLLRAPCATRVARDTSRFVEQGRSGLPPEPGQALPSPLELAEMSATPDPILAPVPSFTQLALVSGGCRP